MSIKVEDRTGASVEHECTGGPECDNHRLDSIMATLARLSADERDATIRHMFGNLFTNIRLVMEAKEALDFCQTALLILASKGDVVIKDSDTVSGVLRCDHDAKLEATVFHYKPIPTAMQESLEEEAELSLLNEDLKEATKKVLPS